MKLFSRSLALGLILSAAAHAQTQPAEAPAPSFTFSGKDVSASGKATPKKLYDDVTPSLVAVQFQFSGETINRELVGPGIVVSGDGLIMTPLALFNINLPDEQLKDFKIIIPSQDKDAEEIDAEFVG